MAQLKKKSHFGSFVYLIVLAAYVILLTLVILFVLKKGWTYAEEHENALPAKVMDVYIAEKNQNLLTGSVMDEISAMPHEFQSDEEVGALVRQMFSSELSYARTVGGDGETRLVYAILCEGRSIGTVTMVRDQSKADSVEFGELPWTIESEEYDFSELYSSLEVTVPQSYSVALNGHPLDAGYIVNYGIHYDVLEEYYKNHPDLPTKVTYHVDHILGHLEPTIYDDLGNVTAIDPTRNDSQFIRPIDDYTMSRLAAFAVAFSDPYLKYSSNATDPYSGYAGVEPYLYPNGELAERLKLTIDGYGWAHTTSYRFDGAQLVNAIALGDGYYSIDINAQTVITYPNKGVNGVVNDNNGLKVLVFDYYGEFKAIEVERYVPGQA